MKPSTRRGRSILLKIISLSGPERHVTNRRVGRGKTHPCVVGRVPVCLTRSVRLVCIRSESGRFWRPVRGSWLDILRCHPNESRREHGRIDVSRRHLDARLMKAPAGQEQESNCSCRLINLSYSGMCLHSEDWFEPGRPYRFALDLSPLLGTAVHVTAHIVWMRSLGVGLCCVGARFLKSSRSWLGPDEEENGVFSSAIESDRGV